MRKWHLFLFFLIEEERFGKVTVARLGGEIDLANSSLLKEALYQIYKAGTGRLIVDIRNISYGDASFLKKLIELQSQIEREGNTLKILAPCEGTIRKILELTRIDLFIKIFYSEEEALSSFLN